MSGKVSMYSAAQKILDRIREERRTKQNKIAPIIIPSATTIKVINYDFHK